MKNTVIKSRAWDEKNKVMHYNFQCIRSGIEGNDWVIFTSDIFPDFDTQKGNPFFSQQIEEMQFSGLTDKNGKEIYEGDIVETRWENEITNEFDGVTEEVEIVFQNGAYWYAVDECYLSEVNEECEIIGNVFENPELLNS